MYCIQVQYHKQNTCRQEMEFIVSYNLANNLYELHSMLSSYMIGQPPSSYLLLLELFPNFRQILRVAQHSIHV